MHAATNHLVDVVLALILMVGGVTGAQFGARAGQRIRSEQLRLLLGLLVLAVGLRFAFRLVLPPDELYSIRPSGGRDMSALLPRHRDAGRLTLSASAATAERLVTSLSNYRVSIASNFTGADLVLFGTIERDAATVARRGGYDIVGDRDRAAPDGGHVPQGPGARHLGQRRIAHLRRCADLSRGADQPAGRGDRRAGRAAAAAARARQHPAAADDRDGSSPTSCATIRSAWRFSGCARSAASIVERTNGVTFLTPTVFRTAIPLPADAPIGTYEVDVKLFADGTLIAREPSAFELYKVGFEQFVASTAREHGFLYGLSTAGLALLIGWLASVVFRRD